MSSMYGQIRRSTWPLPVFTCGRWLPPACLFSWRRWKSETMDVGCMLLPLEQANSLAARMLSLPDMLCAPSLARFSQSLRLYLLLSEQQRAACHYLTALLYNR